MATTEKSHRRRGKELEDAILDATWHLMQTIGYSKMTMDDIAGTARTNKNAIYRRWKTKLDVAMASIRKNVSFQKFYVPDNGDLRTDLVELLSESVPTVSQIGVKNLKGIARDRLATIQENPIFSPTADKKSAPTLEDNFVLQALLAVLGRGFERGELTTAPRTFDRSILVLPILLALSRVISEQDYDLKTVEFFVDKVLLPVFQAQ